MPPKSRGESISGCGPYECLGLELDARTNGSCRPDADVALPNSRARIFVIATREDVTMLREVMRVLGGVADVSELEKKIMGDVNGPRRHWGRLPQAKIPGT